MSAQISVFELNLFLIDNNAIWFSSEVLIVVLGVYLVPVVDRGSASFDPEPLTEVSTFCRRGSSSVGRARQPDQPGWRARLVTIEKLRIRRIRYVYVEFFEEHVHTLMKELRSVQPQSTSVGINILEKEINKMRNEGYGVQVGDAETFESETDFDILVAGEVIEHVKNPSSLLENAEQNLTSNGKLILTTPHPDGFAYFRKAVFGQSNNPTHTCWIDPRNLKQLVSITETDLNVTDWQYLPPVGGVSTVLWKMGLKRAASPGYVAELAIQPE